MMPSAPVVTIFHGAFATESANERFVYPFGRKWAKVQMATPGCFAPMFGSQESLHHREVAVSPQPVDDELSKCSATIMSLQRASDWNGLGAKGITKADCAAAVEFLAEAMAMGVPAPASIGPSPKGNVALTWKLPPNLVYVEISAENKGKVYYQWGGPTTQAKDGVLPAGQFIARFVSELRERLTNITVRR
ncbi:MAG TPA: hypothetical protein VGY53_02450 [Isosphaeraceae bacterium]|jgi:hypothetical protein|nr:hypothetical protein [Isosphaeraceae bacterium]